jgi:predicted secreted protein
MGEDTATRLELAVGESRTVPLRALATAGYSWSVAVDGPDTDAIAVDVQRGDVPPGAPPGPSAPEAAVVRGLAPGSAFVRLEQRRPWESAGEPAATVELDVQVT